ncbi:HET domain-containing protein [Microdochium nivale]|nr:HET domain-containing protein [Microdochium nivale]
MRSEYQQIFSASQLAVARMDSMDLSRWRVSGQLDSHAPITQPLNSFFDTPNDLYRADKKTLLEHRFSWGDYLALSYVWGDGVADHKIVINEQYFMVRSNLYDALCRLHKSDEVRKARLKIWIDAICINQNDMAEREHEVPRMRTIYARALCVRAWLGTPPADLVGAFAALCASVDDALLDVNPPHQKPARENTGSGIDPAVSTISPELAAIKAVREKTGREEDAKIVFFSLSYWKRLWVLQEIALAHSVVFWYGDFWLGPLDLASLMVTIKKPDIRRSDKFTMMADTSVTMRYLRRGAARAADSLRPPRTALHCTAVVLLASAAVASDKRDRVYGALGLVSDSVSRRIKVDYGPSVSSDDVYIQFSMACILAERNPAVRAGLKMSRR